MTINKRRGDGSFVAKDLLKAFFHHDFKSVLLVGHLQRHNESESYSKRIIIFPLDTKDFVVLYKKENWIGGYISNICNENGDCLISKVLSCL